MTKTQKNFLVALVLGLLIFFLVPATNGLTPAGVKFLAVFLPTVVIWLVEGGSGWSALFGTGMIVLLGAYNGVETYKLLWGGTLVSMVIPFYMVANALEESGTMMWVVRWILSRKIVHGRPFLFSVMFIVALLICSIFVSPMVTTVIFFKVLKDLTKSVGIGREDGFYRAHGLIIAWVGQTVDGCLIWGRPFIVSMVAMIVGLGFEKFTINDYFKLSALYLVFVVVVALAFVYLWIRPDTSKFVSFDDEAIRKDLKANPMSKRSKILLGGMAVVIFAYVAAFATILGPVQAYFNPLPSACAISFVAACLAIITCDGKPVLDIGYEASRLPWNTVLFLGAVMYYGGTIGSADYGISACLSNILTPVVSALPATVAIIAGLAIASVFTNLTSNAVTAMCVISCFTPAMLAAPNISDSQVLAFAACVVMICATAVATLAACATMSLVYCPDGIEYKGTAHYSIAYCAVMVLVCAFILVPLGTSIYAPLV